MVKTINTKQSDENLSYATYVFEIDVVGSNEFPLSFFENKMPSDIYLGTSELIYESFPDIPRNNIMIPVPCAIFYTKLVETGEIISISIATTNPCSFPENYKNIFVSVSLVYTCVNKNYKKTNIPEETLQTIITFFENSSRKYIFAMVEKSDNEVEFYKRLGFNELDGLYVDNEKCLTLCKKLHS